MALKRYVGDKIVGLSTDTKPTNVPDGATFYETDTLEFYVLTSGSWELLKPIPGNNKEIFYNNNGALAGATGLTLDSGTFTVNYTSTLKDIKENITVGATAFTGATAFYEVKDNNVLYYTGTNDGNWDLNIRGNSGTTLNTYMAVGESISIAVMATNGAIPYYNNRILIDDVAQTVKWLNGVAPSSGNASSIDVYTYTIIKTAASTYTVLGTRAKFA
jgi:hypothetical protein